MLADCSITCSSGTLNAECTFCECALDLNAQAFSSLGSLSQTSAFVTQPHHWRSCSWRHPMACFLSVKYVREIATSPKEQATLTIEFQAIATLQSLTMQIVGEWKDASSCCVRIQLQIKQSWRNALFYDALIFLLFIRKPDHGDRAARRVRHRGNGGDVVLWSDGHTISWLLRMVCQKILYLKHRL